MKYRKKPVIIEAIQFNGKNGAELNKWSSGKVTHTPDHYVDQLVFVDTLDGQHTGNIGDFIIKGVKGEFYPCKPDIFEMTYEPV